MVEQPGTIRSAPRRAADRSAVPQHPRPSPLRRRAGIALGCVPTRHDRPQPSLLRLLYGRRPGEPQIDGSAAAASTAGPRRARAAGAETSTTRASETTTAASCSSDPTGIRYLATGDGGDTDDPEATRRTCTSLLGKLLRIDPKRRRAELTPMSIPFDIRWTGRDLALGLRNPCRFSFDGRPVTLHRRRRSGLVGGGRLCLRVVAGRRVDLRLGLLEGDARLRARGPPGPVTGGRCSSTSFRRQLLGHRRLRRPRSEVPTCTVATSTRTSAQASSAPSTRPTPAPATRRRPGGQSVESFGEDACGRVYVNTSLPGSVYRIVQG